MAGFRDFQTGEVLTAANVNDFLAKQAVMKFADATARDTALGTAVGGSNALREGMVAYLDDTDDLLKYDGSAWATIGNAGIGSNVVQTVKTDTFTSTSTSFTAVTGLSATITPTSASNKILVCYTLHGAGDLGTSNAAMQLSRGGTAIFIGDAAGSRTRATSMVPAGGDVAQFWNFAGTFLDSPATTSPVTYSVEIRTQAGTVFVNRSSGDSNTSAYYRTPSSLTVIEVAA